jgi:hypothetical protein
VARPGTFPPGKSGNPTGRPKGFVNAQKLARDYTPQAIEALVRGLKDPKHYVAAASALLDRGWGRPTQPLSGDGERPLAIHFTWADASPVLPLPEPDPAPLTIEAEAENTGTDDGVVVVFRKD